MCSTTVLDTQKLPCTSAVDESRAQTNFVSDGPCYDHAYALAAKQCSDTVTSDCDNRELKSCSSCHSSGKYLHRIKQNGTIYLYCVSCVLFHHRNMYCSQCFHVYASPSEIGDLALWLTCSNCHRLCHMKCATEVGLPTDSFFFSCQYCHRNSSNKDNENGSRKRLHLDAECSLLGKENLAATQIVAMFAVQEAKRAKDRARSCAAFAAKAAKAAKSALDKAHKAAIDEAICRLQAHQHSAATSSLNPGGNNLQKEAHSTVVKHPHTIRDLKNNSIQSTPMVACGQADPKAFSSVNRTNGPKFTVSRRHLCSTFLQSQEEMQSSVV
ncbi:hypothetical protein KP509_32G066300 [Ceratopteris richardii]|uniref:Uncharacterized protein n=1 Tax=Ceratopteris richardii TaxID=49495 RepID=A0A8T2QVR6_CERRI|nr:hypothetical protein KP509_32G066300 [Ceratopteris richardii]